MLKLKTTAPHGGTHAPTTIARKRPLTDYPTQTSFICLERAMYLILERSDTCTVMGVVGRWIRSAKEKDALRPRGNEFIYKHSSGYYYLLETVDTTKAGEIVMERNSQSAEKE